jgi:hypothetical protein
VFSGRRRTMMHVNKSEAFSIRRCEWWSIGSEYRTLSKIGYFPLNRLERPEISSLFFETARSFPSFPKQPEANEFYIRISNELPIQIALTYSINLAGSLVSPWPVRQTGLNFPAEFSCSMLLPKSISPDVPIFSRNGEVTFCHHKETFTIFIVLNQFYSFLLAWPANFMRPGKQMQWWCHFSQSATSAQANPSQYQFYSLLLLNIIHAEQLLYLAICGNYSLHFDDFVSVGTAGPWHRKPVRI